jgi:hypothetical protein
MPSVPSLQATCKGVPLLYILMSIFAPYEINKETISGRLFSIAAKREYLASFFPSHSLSGVDANE